MNAYAHHRRRKDRSLTLRRARGWAARYRKVDGSVSHGVSPPPKTSVPHHGQERRPLRSRVRGHAPGDPSPASRVSKPNFRAWERAARHRLGGKPPHAIPRARKALGRRTLADSHGAISLSSRVDVRPPLGAPGMGICLLLPVVTIYNKYLKFQRQRPDRHEV